MCKGQSFVSFWVIFCLLTLLTTQNFEKIKKCLEILSFYTCLPQMLIIQCLAPEISSMTEFFVILGHFLPFDPPNNPKNQNFEKTKKAWRYYNFTLVYCKCWSYDVWLLRYQVWQTEFFVILGFFFFCPFTALTIQKIKILKKMKNVLEMLSFYTWVPWIKIIWCMIPEIQHATEIFLILDHFLPF